MTRTNVYLPPRQKSRLSETARRTGLSEAELIRLAINQLLDDPPRITRKPQTGFVSAEPIAHRADELLEGFGE